MNGTDLQALAAFAHDAQFEKIGARAQEQLKIRILDGIGVALGTRDAAGAAVSPDEPRSEKPQGADAKASPLHDRLSAPHLDFGDVFLASGRVHHPWDAIAPLLVAADAADAGGRELLTAIAVAYAAGTRAFAAGADAPSANACAIAAGTANLQRMDAARAADALAHAGSGAPPTAIDGSDADLDAVLGTMTRLHYADILAQPAIDAALTISTPPVCRPLLGVHSVRVKTFRAACDALGGGDGSDRYRVRTPADAAASLPWLVAVALLDRQVQPRQFTPERVRAQDVQALLNKIAVVPYPPFTAAFPQAMPAQLDVLMADGTQFCTSTNAFRGSTLRPFDWLTACAKFRSLVSPFADDRTITQIEFAVRDLDTGTVRALTTLLGAIPTAPWRSDTAGDRRVASAA